MSLELHNTRMGQRLIESTLPTIARELGQLNSNLNRIASAFETIDSDDIPDAAFLRHVRRSGLPKEESK